MSVYKRPVIAVTCMAIALGVAGCGSSSGEESTGGGSYAEGFPTTDSGEVSRDPQDYHQSVCETEAFENDPSC